MDKVLDQLPGAPSARSCCQVCRSFLRKANRAARRKTKRFRHCGDTEAATVARESTIALQKQLAVHKFGTVCNWLGDAADAVCTFIQLGGVKVLLWTTEAEARVTSESAGRLRIGGVPRSHLAVASVTRAAAIATPRCPS
eukprot:6475565-Amphidinium_carterae.3